MPALTRTPPGPLRALAALLAAASLLWAGAALAAPAASGPAAMPDLPLRPEAAQALGVPGPPAGASLSRVPAEAVLLVVVNFFCPPCHAEVPRLKELARRIEERGFGGRIRLLGIAAGDNERSAASFSSRHQGLPFPLMPDPDLALHKRLGSPPVPALFAVARRGAGLTLLFRREGEFTEDPDAFLDTLLRLLPKAR